MLDTKNHSFAIATSPYPANITENTGCPNNFWHRMYSCSLNMNMIVSFVTLLHRIGFYLCVSPCSSCSVRCDHGTGKSKQVIASFKTSRFFGSLFTQDRFHLERYPNEYALALRLHGTSWNRSKWNCQPFPNGSWSVFEPISHKCDTVRAVPSSSNSCSPRSPL